jgi:predicted Zn-dependent protease with MMP-like domain
MNRERFEQLVADAISGLPDEFLDKLENIDVVVDDRPSPEQLAKSGLKRGETLLGLYQGVPLTRRSSYYGMVTPDKITIFQKKIEDKCRSDSDIRREIQKVVRHEIAHHFGISDARLRQLEKRRD